MAAALGPPTKRAHPTNEICPSNLQNMPIRPTKNAHPTYEKCPSDLQKVPIRPTKKAHPTYKKCPSDLQNLVAVRQLQLIISTLYTALYA